MWTKRGPHAKPNKLRGGLINSETKNNHIEWSEMKTSEKFSFTKSESWQEVMS